MRMDCLSKGRLALLFGVAALTLVACSSSKNKGSTIHTEAGGGSSGGGTGGVSMGGAAGQGGTAGQDGGGGKDGSAGTGGATSCSDFGQTATCTSCLEKNCCAESAACSADASCKTFVQCAEKCPDPIHDTSSACMLACIEAGAPDTNFNALIVCMNQSCATPVCNYP